MNTEEMKVRRPFRLLPVALVIVIWVVAGVAAYAAYRVVTFTDSVFGGSQPPLRAAIATPEARPTALPTRPPAAAPAAAGQPARPAPAPTATAVPTATPVPATGVLGKLRAGQRVTFLLIGYSGPGHDGPYLTDTLVVGSYEPSTGALALFNIPRDLWVQTPASPGGRPGPYRKINEIFSLGLGQGALGGREPTAAEVDRGAWLAAGVAEQVLGLPIDGWASGDFFAVRRVVDGLGGVTVNVETAFDDYEYPRNDDPNVDPGIMHIHFDAGPQRLSGERALQYARSRHAEQDGGDFGRARRQQRLLLALKDQALSPASLPKVFSLMDAVQGHLRTSLSLADARDLVLYGRDRNAGVRPAPTVIDTNLLTMATSDGGASILVPKAGSGNYSAIHRFVQTTLQQIGGAQRAAAR